jgi:hypothetical protein
MAGIVSEQRIDPNCVSAGKVVIDDLVGQRYQEAVAAVRTFDAGFFTNTGSPFCPRNTNCGKAVQSLSFGLSIAI